MNAYFELKDIARNGGFALAFVGKNLDDRRSTGIISENVLFDTPSLSEDASDFSEDSINNVLNLFQDATHVLIISDPTVRYGVATYALGTEDILREDSPRDVETVGETYFDLQDGQWYAADMN